MSSSFVPHKSTDECRWLQCDTTKHKQPHTFWKQVFVSSLNWLMSSMSLTQLPVKYSAFHRDHLQSPLKFGLNWSILLEVWSPVIWYSPHGHSTAMHLLVDGNIIKLVLLLCGFPGVETQVAASWVAQCGQRGKELQEGEVKQRWETQGGTCYEFSLVVKNKY